MIFSDANNIYKMIFADANNANKIIFWCKHYL